MKDLRVMVRRDGQQKAILPGDVVVGDIVVIEPGMEIAGDGYVVDASMVLVDESSLTGESELKKGSFGQMSRTRRKMQTRR